MTTDSEAARQTRAERLKERIYLAFVALAVVVSLGSHEVHAWDALGTLLVTTFGTLLAIFVADVIAHFVVEERGMTVLELRHALIASFGALTAIIVPVVALLIAVPGWWSVDTALFVSAAGLIVSLVVIGYAAVRRIPMTWWQRLIALGLEAVLGLAIVGLKILAHG